MNKTFADRAEAGRALAQRLVEMPLPRPLVGLALPRGEVDAIVCLAEPFPFHAIECESVSVSERV